MFKFCVNIMDFICCKKIPTYEKTQVNTLQNLKRNIIYHGNHAYHGIASYGLTRLVKAFLTISSELFRFLRKSGKNAGL